MQRMVLQLALKAVLVFAGALAVASAAVITRRYVGDLQGVRADAAVAFEPLPDYIRVAGQIQSKYARYGFTADLVGDSGFGTILDLGSGSRWQIKIQVFTKGFALTSNPFGPGSPTTYYFKLVESP